MLSRKLKLSAVLTLSSYGHKLTLHLRVDHKSVFKLGYVTSK
jgi:hypothetical protein